MKLLVFLALVYLSCARVAFFQKDKKVDGSYLIQFNFNASTEAVQNVLGGVTVNHVYKFDDLKLVHVSLTNEQLQNVLSGDSNVIDYVEEDGIVTIAQSCSTAPQTPDVWNLDRLTQEKTIVANTKFRFNPNGGTGVRSYIIDTGILITHDQFEGRARLGINYAGGSSNDCNGHGTHVAGTVGGKTYGVAKKVTLIAVKVLDCAGSGSNANVIKGIEWVRTDCTTPRKCNINMSLGGGASTAVDNAVSQLVTYGVTVVVAAGNENQNACNVSPARSTAAITVGATQKSALGNNQVDVRSTFSNWGTCVDIFAPGTSITSAWYTSNTATNTISGTSMASPLVAGVVSVHQSLGDHLPAALKTLVKNQSVKDAITMNCAAPCSSSVNQLVHLNC